MSFMSATFFALVILSDWLFDPHKMALGILNKLCVFLPSHVSHLDQWNGIEHNGDMVLAG